jgi:hypothetical protein
MYEALYYWFYWFYLVTLYPDELDVTHPASINLSLKLLSEINILVLKEFPTRDSPSPPTA